MSTYITSSIKSNKSSRKYAKLDSSGDVELSQPTFSIDDGDETDQNIGQTSNGGGMNGHVRDGPFSTSPPSSSPQPKPMKHPVLILMSFFLMGGIAAATIMLPIFLSPLENPPYVTYSIEEAFVRWLPQWSLLPDYLSVSRHTATQINQANCGLASVTSLLNYMLANNHIPTPNATVLNDKWSPYTYATQTTWRSDACVSMYIETDNFDGVYTPPYGTTLDQISHVVKCLLPSSFKVSTLSIASNENHASFAKRVTEACGNRCYGLINFLRTALDQPGGGHWSPIVISGSGVHVVSDVAKYKEYSAYSVTDEALFDAVNNIDECGKWDYGSQDPSETDEEEWKVTISCNPAPRGLIIISY